MLGFTGAGTVFRAGIISFLWLILTLFDTTSPCLAEEADDGYKLKVAYLYNFTKFVEWPEAKSIASRFGVCVLGANSFGNLLEPLREQKALGLPIEILVVTSPDQADTCHILFISASEQKRIGSLVKAWAGKGILTVGDTDGYAKSGVAINFMFRHSRLRFAINPDAALSNGLRIRSGLLRLAEIVKSP